MLARARARARSAAANPTGPGAHRQGMTIVTLSGSLRAVSSNAALLQAAAALAPPGMQVVHYTGLGELPPFNPDLDGEGAAASAPAPVRVLRALLGRADGFVISSPEYAHGVPGAFKNALDWVVSSGELVEKPIILLNAAPAGGQHAHAALVEILRTMSAEVLTEASHLQPFLPRKLGPGASLDDASAAALRRCLAALAQAVTARLSSPA